jgi:hypothetical protein
MFHILIEIEVKIYTVLGTVFGVHILKIIFYESGLGDRYSAGIVRCNLEGSRGSLSVDEGLRQSLVSLLGYIDDSRERAR